MTPLHHHDVHTFSDLILSEPVVCITTTHTFSDLISDPWWDPWYARTRRKEER